MGPIGLATKGGPGKCGPLASSKPGLQLGPLSTWLELPT